MARKKKSEAPPKNGPAPVAAEKPAPPPSGRRTERRDHCAYPGCDVKLAPGQEYYCDGHLIWPQAEKKGPAA